MTSVKDVDGTKLIRPIVPAEIAIIFVSANNSGPKQGSFFNGPDATIDDNGGSFMVMYEFAYALSRLAFECFPQFPSIVDRAQSFVERIIVPGVGHMLDPVSALLDWLFSRRTAAVFDYHDELMRDIFACYAKSDRRNAATTNRLHSMNISEFLFLLEEGGIFERGISPKAAAGTFTQVCTLYQGDSSEEELEYPEFLTVVARVCDLVTDRGAGDGFEEALAHWLEEIFLPKYSKLMRLKQQGKQRVQLK